MSYDLLGRRKTLRSLDTGPTEYFFDPAGNLTKKVDENLRALHQAVRYTYQYSRLTGVDRPFARRHRVRVRRARGGGSRQEKHGDADYEEPASEAYAKQKAREAEKNRGKDARREGHDAKEPGEGDRSKRALDEDYGE